MAARKGRGTDGYRRGSKTTPTDPRADRVDARTFAFPNVETRVPYPVGGPDRAAELQTTLTADFDGMREVALQSAVNPMGAEVEEPEETETNDAAEDAAEGETDDMPMWGTAPAPEIEAKLTQAKVDKAEQTIERERVEGERSTVHVVSYVPEAEHRTPANCANALNHNQNAAEFLSDEMEKDLVDLVQACFDMSHASIEERYNHWQEAEIAHDVYVPTSKLSEAKKSNVKTRRGMKPRLVDTIMTPYSRAISDTQATYMLAVFGGNPAFRIEPIGKRGTRQSAKIIETELHANMRRIGFEARLYQMALDNNRYGMCPTAIFWGDGGNVPVNIDPWNFFPDPRTTSQNRHESEFMGWRTTSSLSALFRRKMYQNLHKLKQSRGNNKRSSWRCNLEIRDSIRGQSIDQTLDPVSGNAARFQLGALHTINSLYIWLDPTMVGIPAPFGLYRIVVADEEHILLFDRTPFMHNQIPVIFGSAGYDAHKTFMSGTYDLIMPLQRFQDWLLRSRVENVQALIQSRLIVDPTKVNVLDILQPNAARLIRTLSGQNPKEGVMPIAVEDATRGFWNDMSNTGDLMQRVSAANDTAQGVQSETQRTATEIARITALGQQRLGMNARLMSSTTVRPMVLQMVSNLQEFGVDGGHIQLPSPFNKNARDGWVQWARNDIQGAYDYLIVDGTLPVSPTENADNIRRAIEMLVQAQQAGLARSWNVDALVERLANTWGIEDTTPFKYPDGGQAPLASTPDARAALKAAQIQQQGQLANTPLQKNCVRDEEAARMLEKGDVAPASVAQAEAGGAIPEGLLPGPPLPSNFPQYMQ